MDLIIDALASYRIARLVTQDDLTRGPRDRIWGWAQKHDHPKVAEFIVCPYCVSVWAAGAMVLVGPRIPAVRRILAVAGLAALAVEIAESRNQPR